MSLTGNNHEFITTNSGGIDYAYYDNRARMARSETFSDSPAVFKAFLRGLVSRLSLPPVFPARGPVATPCG